MLVLSRNLNERIFVSIPASNAPIQVTLMVCSLSQKGSVRIGIDAPESVRIYRDDIQKTEPSK